MKTFDVQTIEIQAPYEKTFAYLARAENLPQWTNAFRSATPGLATLRTPAGEIEVALIVNASLQEGTIDWTMTFPDASVAKACSRVIQASPNSVVYTFVLFAPPLPLEKLEGALEEQSRVLRQELSRLKQILEEQ